MEGWNFGEMITSQFKYASSALGDMIPNAPDIAGLTVVHMVLQSANDAYDDAMGFASTGTRYSDMPYSQRFGQSLKVAFGFAYMSDYWSRSFTPSAGMLRG